MSMDGDGERGHVGIDLWTLLFLFFAPKTKTRGVGQVGRGGRMGCSKNNDSKKRSKLWAATAVKKRIFDCESRAGGSPADPPFQEIVCRREEGECAGKVGEMIFDQRDQNTSFTCWQGRLEPKAS